MQKFRELLLLHLQLSCRGNGREGRSDVVGEKLAEEAEAAERSEMAVISHRIPSSGTGLPAKWVLRHCHLWIQKSLPPPLRVSLELRIFIHQTWLQATGAGVRAWKSFSQACLPYSIVPWVHLLQLQAGSAGTAPSSGPAWRSGS